MGNPAEKPGNGFIYFPTYQISHEHFKLCHIISVKMKKKPQNLLLGGRKSYLREEEAVQKAAAFSRQKQFFFCFTFSAARSHYFSSPSQCQGGTTQPYPVTSGGGHGAAEEMPGSVVGQESAVPPRSSPCPVGIKPLGADARRAR